MKFDLRRLARLVLPLACLLSACQSAETESDATTTTSTYDDPNVEALSNACSAPDEDPSPDPIVAACTRLIRKRTGYMRTCSVWGQPVIDEKAGIDSCVGIATSPGAALSAADIDGCGEEICQGCPAGGMPTCLGYGANMLFPNHDKKGTAKPGEACIANLQCESGHCSASYKSCGTCQSPRALGEACGGSFDVCTEGGCTDGICAFSGKKEGESCTNYGGGDCASDFFCEPMDTGTIEGLCVARGKESAPCAADEECAQGMYCSVNGCAVLLPDGAVCQAGQRCVNSCIDGVCTIPQLGLHEGDDCSFSMVCRDGLLCENKVCVPVQYIAEGAACEGQNVFCGPENACDSACPIGECDADQSCLPRPGPGEPCTINMACAAGSYCIGFAPAEGNRGICFKEGAENEPCPCGDDLTCVSGKCVPFGQAMCD